LACVTIKTKENICAAISKLFMTVHFQSRWSYLLSTTNRQQQPTLEDRLQKTIHNKVLHQIELHSEPPGAT
jgi:hypothetical protein